METLSIRHFREFNSKGEKIHLKELLSVGYNGLIPNKVILDKTIPGLGATTCEIESERHSIIIEPNVPVIDGKMKKYPNERWPYPILGIRKGISRRTIETYLKNPAIKYKKILITPESYNGKLKDTFKTLQIDSYYKDYFFLLDEMEKFTQDVDFRKGMFFVMRDFWKYEKKAMVSATPIVPSDKAFQREEFKILKIEPKFDYSKTVFVNISNSILDAIDEYMGTVIQKLKIRKVCFFINSINIIDNVIKHLNVKDKSRIYCSEDSFAKLNDLGYTEYSSFINQTPQHTTDLTQFSFFTSRFFSAVDIDLPKNEDVAVFIISDTYFAPYSVVDPETHAKQIIGRFRNDSTVNIIITNTRDDIKFKSKDYMINFNEGSFAAFKAIHTMYRNEEHPVKKQAMADALKQLRFFDYTYVYNNKIMINHGILDNQIETEKVKELYSNGRLLDYAYRKDKYYDVVSRSLTYKKSDKARYERENMDLGALREEMININEQIINGEIDGLLADHFTEYQLKRESGFILGAAYYLEKEDLKKLNYDEELIDPILNTLLANNVNSLILLRKAIRKYFQVGKRYSRRYISDKLEYIFQLLNIDKSTKATNLSDYCLLSEPVNISKKDFMMPSEKRNKGFIILEHLFANDEII